MSLNGIDIASYQSTLVPSKMITTNFIIIKATQGSTYNNPTFEKQYHQTKEAGKLLGIYHYINGCGVQKQVDHFLKAVNSVNGIGEAILAVDEEKKDNAQFGNEAYVKEIMDQIFKETGVMPFFYTSYSVSKNYPNIQKAGYQLWGARYASQQPTDFQTFPWDNGQPWGNWNKPTIRQYSSKGKITGYSGDVDLDIFYGTKEDWKKFATPVTKTNTTTGGVKVATDFSKYYNKISNSGSDEKGNYHGGSAGDQTGNEWNIRTWYNRPWTCVLRYPDKAVRELIAELSIKAANNNNIGYDQWQRDTYWTQLQKVGYDPSKITTKCEADCSAGVIANTKAAGYIKNISALKNISATYTGNMKSGFKAAGFQVLTDSKYLTSTAYLVPGDILLNEKHHTATNLGIGSKSGYTQTKPTATPTPAPAPGKKSVTEIAKEVIDGKWGTGETRKKNLANAGYNYTEVQNKVNELLKGGSSSSSSAPKTIPTYSGTWSKTVVRTGEATTLLNVRMGPGTENRNLTSYPTIKKGTKVGVCMQTTARNGGKWYYVKLTGSKGEKFGFVSANYIKLV